MLVNNYFIANIHYIAKTIPVDKGVVFCCHKNMV